MELLHNQHQSTVTAHRWRTTSASELASAHFHLVLQTQALFTLPTTPPSRPSRQIQHPSQPFSQRSDVCMTFLSKNLFFHHLCDAHSQERRIWLRISMIDLCEFIWGRRSRGLSVMTASLTSALLFWQHATSSAPWCEKQTPDFTWSTTFCEQTAHGLGSFGAGTPLIWERVAVRMTRAQSSD